MTPPIEETLKHWLLAENRLFAENRLPTESRGADQPDLDDSAQAALRELMVALPDARPSSGFADRVMMASGLEKARTWNVEFLLTRLFGPADVPSAALQAVAGVVLVLVGSAMASLPSLAARLGEWIIAADLASGMAHVFTFAAGSMATVLAVGQFLESLYEVLLLILLSPPVVLAALGAFLFSTLTLRWLAQLLSLTPFSFTPSQRSSGYVPVH